MPEIVVICDHFVGDEADIGSIGSLADRTLHPDAARQPVTLQQTLPGSWNGLMQLSLDKAVAYWTPTGGTPIVLESTVFTNAQLPRTIYLEGDGCGEGVASFSVVGLPDCETNMPFDVFGVNATLDGVAEADEESPGGLILDHTAHTNAPRTLLTLEACGPASAAGTVDLTWNSSLVEIYASPTGGTALTQFSEPFAGFSTTNLYVQGIAPGTNLLEWSYSEQADCADEILVNILKVELLVNNTTNQQDDVVVKEITSGNYRAGAKDGTINAQNIGLGTIGTQGPTDNHIPMTIRLSGPTSFSCNVKLFDSSPVGGGDVAIRMTNGVAYPAIGCLVTAGADYEVHIYGQTESSSLNDVKIEAKTDLTGDSVCANEDLSVLFVTLSFKGAGNFSANNAVNLSAFGGNYAGLTNACGLYQMDMTNADARVFNVMEIEVTIKPDDQPIPGVTWDIKREKERTEWTDGVPLHSPIPYSTTATESDDDGSDPDEDLAQGPGDLRIYSIDAVGLLLQPTTMNRTKILNFREWVEVKVPRNGQAPYAAKWFVASEYEYWHVLLKATNSGTLFNPNWARIGHSGAGSIPSADNEVEPGNYTDAVTSWTEH